MFQRQLAVPPLFPYTGEGDERILGSPCMEARGMWALRTWDLKTNRTTNEYLFLTLKLVKVDQSLFSLSLLLVHIRKTLCSQ